MTRYKLFIFCVLSSVLSIAQNQPTIDSLFQILKTDISDKDKVDVYLNIAKKHRGVDYKKTNFYNDKALVLAEKTNYTEGIVTVLLRKGVYFLNKEKNIEAEQVYKKLLDFANKVNDSISRVKAYRGLGKANRGMKRMDLAFQYFMESLEGSQKWEVNTEQAFNYNAIGLIYNEQGNYTKALEYCLISLDLFKQLDYKKGISIVYINLGILHRKTDDFKKAIEFFNHSIKIENVLNRKSKISNNLFHLGQTYYQIKDYDKALEYYFESLKVFPTEIGKERIRGTTYSNIANVYIALQDYKKALEFNFKSLKIYEDISLNARKPNIYYAISQIYNLQNETKLARKYTNKGLVLARQHGFIKDIRNGAQQLALIEKENGNYKKAYEANTLLIQMKDSLYNEETIRKLATLEAQYQFRKEKDSLQLVRQQEIVLSKEKIKQREARTLIIYVFVGLFLIIGGACFIVTYKALQRKKIRLLRNHISRDLHDEIGSTLSSIALYGTVARTNIIKDPEKTSELLTLINSYSSSTIESMNDIVWAINSEEDSIGDLISRMRSFANGIENTKEWKIDIHYESGIIDRKLNMIQRRNMYFIFKEALNNALKYSKGKEIQVNIDVENNFITLDIKDDGIGFESNKVIEEKKPFGGNGLKNMKKRGKELGGKLAIYSIFEKGTKVSLEFNMNTKQ